MQIRYQFFCVRKFKKNHYLTLEFATIKASLLMLNFRLIRLIASQKKKLTGLHIFCCQKENDDDEIYL